MRNFTMENIPRMMTFTKAAPDVVRAYPEQAWSIIKKLYTDLEDLRMVTGEAKVVVEPKAKPTGDPIQLTDMQVTNALRELVSSADTDTIAMLCEEAFGGLVTTDGETYTLTPDENYNGEFNDLQTDEELKALAEFQADTTKLQEDARPVVIEEQNDGVKELVKECVASGKLVLDNLVLSDNGIPLEDLEAEQLKENDLKETKKPKPKTKAKKTKKTKK